MNSLMKIIFLFFLLISYSFENSINSRLDNIVIFNSKIKKQINSIFSIGSNEFKGKETIIVVKDLIVDYNYSLDSQYDKEEHDKIRYKITTMEDENKLLLNFVNDTIQKIEIEEFNSGITILKTEMWKIDYYQINFRDKVFIYFNNIFYIIESNQRKKENENNEIDILMKHNLFFFNKYNVSYVKPWKL